MEPDRLVPALVAATLGPCQKDASLAPMHSSLWCSPRKIVSATADLGMPKDAIFKGIQLLHVFFIYLRPFRSVLQVLRRGCVCVNWEPWLLLGWAAVLSLLGRDVQGSGRTVPELLPGRSFGVSSW